MRNFRVLSFAEQAKVCAANFYFVESNFVLTNRHSSYARLTEQRNFRFCDPSLLLRKSGSVPGLKVTRCPQKGLRAETMSTYYIPICFDAKLKVNIVFKNCFCYPFIVSMDGFTLSVAFGHIKSSRARASRVKVSSRPYEREYSMGY